MKINCVFWFKLIRANLKTIPIGFMNDKEIPC